MGICIRCFQEGLCPGDGGVGWGSRSGAGWGLCLCLHLCTLHFAPSSYFGSGRFGQPHCSWAGRAAPPPSVAVATVKTVLPSRFAYSLQSWNDEPSSSGLCFDSRYLGPTMDSSGRSGVQSRYTERSDEASNVSTTTVTSKTKTTTTTRTGPPMPTPDYVPLAMASGYVRREEPERPEPAMLYLRPGSLGLGRPPTTPGQSPPSGQIQPVANQPAFPPKASSTGKRFYVFRPEHNYGPVVGCGWPLSAALWSSTEPRPRAPEGFRGLEEAVAKCFEEHPDCPEVRIRRS